MTFQCTRLSSEPDLVRASANQPPLRQGSHGDGVSALQLALIDLGSAMPISTSNGQSLPDGVFGAETLAAVKTFQRTNALAVDGVVGAMTLATLDQRLAARSEALARADLASGNVSKGLSSWR